MSGTAGERKTAKTQMITISQQRADTVGAGKAHRIEEEIKVDIDIITDKKNADSTTVHIRPVCDLCGYVFSSSDNLHVEYVRELVGTQGAKLAVRTPFIMPFCCPSCKKRIASILAEGELFRQLVNETKKYDNDNVIELPCKEHFVYKHDDGHITENWRVFYRGEFALIETAFFPTEPEADAFLAELKGGKR